MAKRLDAEFAKLRVMVYQTATPDQLRELRRAFFAGAEALRRVIFRCLEDTGNPNDVTNGDLALMQEIDDEIHGFAADVKAGRA